MRIRTLTVLALLSMSPWVNAQQNGQQTPGQQVVGVADPNAAKLDYVLQQWEKSMTSLQSLTAHCKRTTIDKTYQTTEVYEGTAKFLKSTLSNQSSRASLEMYKQGNRNTFEKYICTGTFLYEYAPGNKEIRVHELPPPKQGQFAEDNFLSFLFGMKAVEAKNRYELTYVPPPANDKWYYYIRIKPRSARDKADFTEARLVLLASNFMPRQLWFQQPNRNEISWDFPKVVPNSEIRATDFTQPQLPAGWRFVRAPAQAQARVIRQNQ